MIQTVTDRASAPKITIPETVNIKPAQKQLLSKGKDIYILPHNIPDLVRFEVVFDAGTIKHLNPILPSLTNSMLDEGTRRHSARELAETFDYYAANLGFNVGKHTATLTLHSLRKHFDKLLNLFVEMINEPVFPENEFEIVRQHQYQNFLIKRENTEFLATEKFWQLIFGTNHAYGISVSPENFLSPGTADLKKFHESHYKGGKALFIFSGDQDDKMLNLIDENLKNFNPAEGKGFFAPAEALSPEKEKIHFINKKGAMQASVRMGMAGINKMHPDYIKLNITNVVLGGYFGSRLMTNIREDKGYTYGIYSSVGSLFDAGYFLISAETRQDTAHRVVEEIKKEIARLRREPIPEQELKTVRHYLLGSLLENFDGTDAKANAFKSVHFYGMDESWYLKYIQTLKTITPQDIMQTADTYLREEDMYEVICADAANIS